MNDSWRENNFLLLKNRFVFDFDKGNDVTSNFISVTTLGFAFHAYAGAKIKERANFGVEIFVFLAQTLYT